MRSVRDTVERPNAGLQRRRASGIQAEGKKLLEKQAIAPSAARLCWAAALTYVDTKLRERAPFSPT